MVELVATGVFKDLRISLWIGDLLTAEVEAIICPFFQAQSPDILGYTLNDISTRVDGRIVDELRQKLDIAEDIVCTSSGGLFASTIINVDLCNKEDFKYDTPENQNKAKSTFKRALEYGNLIGCRSIALSPLFCDTELRPDLSAKIQLEAIENFRLEIINMEGYFLQEVNFYMNNSWNQIAEFLISFVGNSQKYRSSMYLGTVIENEYGVLCPKCRDLINNINYIDDENRCTRCRMFLGNGAKSQLSRSIN